MPGRPRKPAPGMPAHIDAAKLPRGVYWDRSGAGRWYMLTIDEHGKRKARTIAQRTATLADLHRIAEQAATPDHGTLDALLRTFEASRDFAELSSATQRSYRHSRRIVSESTGRKGTRFGSLPVARIEPPLVQRLIDQIAERTPTAAKHAHQYLRRVFRWGVNRGHCPHNPAQGIEAPKTTPRRRLPAHDAHAALLAYAADRGQRLPHSAGSVPAYVWMAMELAYLCHLRGIEVVTLTDAHITAEHLVTNRRKGSRDTRFTLTPRLRAVIDAAQARRTGIWQRTRRPVPMRAEDRPILVNEEGNPISKSTLDTAWQRLIHAAIADGILTPDQRFGLHDLKRKATTDREGTRADKQLATGHRSASMLDVYDLSVPETKPTGG